jgi:hypothetical protein
MLNTLNSEKSLKNAIYEDSERHILKNFVQSENNENVISAIEDDLAGKLKIKLTK